VQHRLRCLQFIGILLATVAIGRSASAQDGPANGQGYTPMPPLGPGSPSSFTRPVVPGPPQQPTTASRPATWPGNVEPEASPWVPPNQRSGSPPGSAAAGAPAGEIKPCDGTRIIGRVGSEAILESEVLGTVNEFLQQNQKSIPPEQVDQYRELLIQKRLRSLIETKLIYQDARRTLPTEAWPNVEKQLTKQFDEVELDKMMKKAGASTRREFDEKLNTLGTSLDREKRAFIERTLAGEWIHRQVKRDEEPTYDQMVACYRDHLQEFTTPARVQWEELMVRYGKYPTKAAAFEAIAQMGNRVLNGEPFANVAKSGSDGVTAAKGGQCDWTSKGALVCQALDEALFGLPVGQLSPIITGDRGYHIIRVTRREEQAVTPFLQAQVDIKKKIVDQRSQKQFREYMAQLEARTPVWTIFDDKAGNPQTATPRQPLRR
jgi:parvulin-like peptidyl-prolyl isomerase